LSPLPAESKAPLSPALPLLLGLLCPCLLLLVLWSRASGLSPPLLGLLELCLLLF
jgi:hypothetical protein